MKKILNHAIWNTHALLLGRIGVGGFFLYAGIMKVMAGVDGTAGAIASAGFPAAAVLAWVVVLIEIGGGAAVILGKYFREATITLAVFVVFISIFMHNPMDAAQQGMFLKNMAVAGGLLFMAAHGTGNVWKLK